MQETIQTEHEQDTWKGYGVDTWLKADGQKDDTEKYVCVMQERMPPLEEGKPDKLVLTLEHNDQRYKFDCNWTNKQFIKNSECIVYPSDIVGCEIALTKKRDRNPQLKKEVDVLRITGINKK